MFCLLPLSVRGGVHDSSSDDATNPCGSGSCCSGCSKPAGAILGSVFYGSKAMSSGLCRISVSSRVWGFRGLVFEV